MKLIVKQITIKAPVELVYDLLTTPDLFIRWMADDARIEPHAGGVIRWRHANGDVCSGHFVELVPPRRVVFTYGWERPEVQIPPGSTTVEIDLTGHGDGGTRLRLVHRGLAGPMADAHAGGWTHYLTRLATAALGGDPGPDPYADIRVPTPEELARR